MERLRLSGVLPDRTLGQNFLVDPNILDVIDRAASLSAEDVVLEVGPGAGVLTERLLERCGRVHAIEVDSGLVPVLEDEFADDARLTIYTADAMNLDLGSLSPPPNKFVANLPYNIAAPLIVKSLAELPSLELWCLMLQKEIADRLFAATGSRNYGGMSVITRLLTQKVSSRPVSGAVFYPRPRVRSSLLVFRRQLVFSGSEFARVQSLVRAAFSHRRKTLVNSIMEAPAVPRSLLSLGPVRRKELVVSALEELDLSVASRPQALSPEQYQLLAAHLLEGKPHV